MHPSPHVIRFPALALVLALAACAAPIPKVQDFDHFDKQYSMMIANDIEILQERYAAGEISKAQMDAELERYEAQRYQKVNELVEHSHQLKESYARTFGIPISGPGRIFNKITSGVAPQFNPRANAHLPDMSSFDSTSRYRGP